MLLNPAKRFKSLKEAIGFYDDAGPVAGIYCIWAMEYKSLYIGMSLNLGGRFAHHIKTYHYNYGEQLMLHKFYDIVGVENLRVTILYEDYSGKTTREQLELIESVFVELYVSKEFDLINNMRVHKEVITRYSQVGILQKSINNEIEGIFDNIYQMMAPYRLQTVNILSCCNNTLKSCIGKRWEYSVPKNAEFSNAVLMRTHQSLGLEIFKVRRRGSGRYYGSN